MYINHSQPQVIFTDYDDNHAPYEGIALKMSLSSDVLFLYIGKLTEQRDADEFHHDDRSIGVDAEALYEALGTMLRRADRYAHARAKAGELPADHPAWSSKLQVAATRQRT